MGAGRVGSTTASAGRAAPGSGRSRSRAVATMAPVDPADMTAAAWPRCTSWHAMAMLDRGRRQLRQRTLLHADRLLGGHHPDQVGGIVAGQQRAQQARAAGQGDADLMLADGDDRARHDLLRGVIAAHRVHRDQRRAPGRGARNRAQRLGRVRLLVGGLRSGGQRREGGGGGALRCGTGRYRTRQRRLGRLRRRGRLRSLPHAAKPLILRGRRGGRCPTRPGRVWPGTASVRLGLPARA